MSLIYESHTVLYLYLEVVKYEFQVGKKIVFALIFIDKYIYIYIYIYYSVFYVHDWTVIIVSYD